ncbi:hypothetical protein C7R93_29620 [Brevibacillus fortis]|uniref:Uncharacterized protein n=1 Tax=Brevibacillus fortis TaxID=2126352 RepID=A0A2P7UF46_9BACL|nr:hypothetical protein C7R93_29620 [Brevibacillus fortis]
MFSSRLFPLFVRAVSFRTCDRASRQLCMCSETLHHSESRTVSFFESTRRLFYQSRVGRSAFPVQAPLEPHSAMK